MLVVVVTTILIMKLKRIEKSEIVYLTRYDLSTSKYIIKTFNKNINTNFETKELIDCFNFISKVNRMKFL